MIGVISLIVLNIYSKSFKICRRQYLTYLNKLMFLIFIQQGLSDVQTLNGFKLFETTHRTPRALTKPTGRLVQDSPIHYI